MQARAYEITQERAAQGKPVYYRVAGPEADEASRRIEELFRYHMIDLKYEVTKYGQGEDPDRKHGSILQQIQIDAQLPDFKSDREVPGNRQ